MAAFDQASSPNGIRINSLNEDDESLVTSQTDQTKTADHQRSDKLIPALPLRDTIVSKDKSPRSNTSPYSR
jgi:hypothetical protein